MIKCNLFEIDIKLVGSQLTFTCTTDLPKGTIINWSVERSYLDIDNEECLWILGDGRVKTFATESGKSSVVANLDLVEGDRIAFERFKEIDSESFDTMKNTLSAKVFVSCVVGGRQQNRDFGKNNQNLSGKFCREFGSLKAVEEKVEFKHVVAVASHW